MIKSDWHKSVVFDEFSVSLFDKNDKKWINRKERMRNEYEMNEKREMNNKNDKEEMKEKESLKGGSNSRPFAY